MGVTNIESLKVNYLFAELLLVYWMLALQEGWMILINPCVKVFIIFDSYIKIIGVKKVVISINSGATSLS
ncbi:hypothetical protein BA188_22755 [Aeromonas hydrophila]|nr:hypothetical protein OI72_10245 [Aeromonas hydrophila]OFC43145.1 hypothetical protein BA189_22390 [Aeromonas hydrophila]OFC54350.1 hypothetical protein BA188_22755 [Aeromonas hydrophila]